MDADTRSPTSRATGFRLRGRGDHADICVLLRPGRTVLGSAPDNDAVIVAPAISRHHAAIQLDEGCLEVTDLGSKNGTFVNGVRVKRQRLVTSDWVQLGPVVLLVEEVADADTTLSISIDDCETCTRLLPDDQAKTATPGPGTPGEPIRWVSLIASLLPDLLVGSRERLPSVLADLAAGLGARGAILAELDDGGEATVLAASGPVETLSEILEHTRVAGQATPAERRLGLFTHVESDTPIAWAAAATRGSPATVLGVGGDFPLRRAVAPLLQVVLRLLVGAPEPPLDEERAPAPSGLVFPRRHVRGRSAATANLYEQIRQLAAGDLSVLIVGETGSGKEHIGRTLHLSSARCDGPFVAVNCAAIPADLLEAELFGIEAGVATGVARREGKFQQASGGVVFLDEVADMSPALQAKLLRALQEREVHPVGARAPRPVDIRVVAATNADIETRIASGAFRRDLFFRIAGCILRVPPLRERAEDIPALVAHFLRLAAAEAKKRVRGVTVGALADLSRAPWPGNVRELEHEVRRLVHLCPDGHPVDSTMISPAVLFPSLPDPPQDMGGDLRLGYHVEQLERRLITAALGRTRGNRSRAAVLLGISRAGLLMKLERLGLDL